MGNAYTNNFDVLIKNLEDLGSDAMQKFEIVADETIAYMKEELTKNIAVEDEHTLKVLEEMGHPYGYHGGESQNIDSQITSRSGGSVGLPHEEPLIHHQGVREGNTIKDAIKTFKLLEGSRLIMAVYVDEKIAPHIKYVVNGTSKMVPRPVFTYTWQKIRGFCLAKVKNGLTRSISARKKKM